MHMLFITLAIPAQEEVLGSSMVTLFSPLLDRPGQWRNAPRTPTAKADLVRAMIDLEWEDHASTTQFGWEAGRPFLTLYGPSDHLGGPSDHLGGVGGSLFGLGEAHIVISNPIHGGPTTDNGPMFRNMSKRHLAVDEMGGATHLSTMCLTAVATFAAQSGGVASPGAPNPLSNEQRHSSCAQGTCCSFPFPT